MQNLHRTVIAKESPAVKPPRFPKAVTTCRAAVLASLLAPGEFDTECMFAPGTIGLHIVMRALVRRYRWPVVRRDSATGTGWATTWILNPDAKAAALDAGGRAWLDAYKAARAVRAGGRLDGHAFQMSPSSGRR